MWLHLDVTGWETVRLELVAVSLGCHYNQAKDTIGAIKEINCQLEFC